MKRFIEGVSRTQSTLFPEALEGYIAVGNPVRVIDVFVDGLSLEKHGFSSAQPEATGRPAYHPSTLGHIRPLGNFATESFSARRSRWGNQW